MVVEFLPSPLGRCLLFLLLWCEIALKTCKRDSKQVAYKMTRTGHCPKICPFHPFLSLPIPLQAIVKYFGLSHTQSHTDLWNPLDQSLYQCPVKGQKEFFTYRYKPNSTCQSSIHLENGWKWMNNWHKRISMAPHSKSPSRIYMDLYGFMGFPWNYNSRLPFSPHQMQSLRHASRVLKNLQRFLKPSCTFIF